MVPDPFIPQWKINVLEKLNFLNFFSSTQSLQLNKWVKWQFFIQDFAQINVLWGLVRSPVTTSQYCCLFNNSKNWPLAQRMFFYGFYKMQMHYFKCISFPEHSWPSVLVNGGLVFSLIPEKSCVWHSIRQYICTKNITSVTSERNIMVSSSNYINCLYHIQC